MRLLRHALAAFAPALAVIPPLMFQCGENGSQCKFDDVGGDFEHYNVAIQIDAPPTCPVLVQVRQEEAYFNVGVTMDTSLLFYSEDDFQLADIGGPIYNGRNDTLNLVGTEFFDQHNGTAVAEPQGSYLVGTDSLAQDYADMFLNNRLTQGADGWEGIVFLPFKIGTYAHVQGPSGVYVGVNNTWTGSASNGTPPYTYKWLRNDTLQSGQTGSTYATSARKVGSIRVSAVVMDSKNRTDTSTDTVNVSFHASISGATQILSPGGSCIWTAQLSGGVQPVTYSWTWDGKGAGNTASLSEEISTSPHTIGLSVQDAAGNLSSQNLSVTLVRSGGVACQQ